MDELISFRSKQRDGNASYFEAGGAYGEDCDCAEQIPHANDKRL